ncbi:MAG: hypothetical protein OSJ83_01895 [Clostridia bacterium]|nr:hypothetical protein [Clostridia bacterium]
MNAKQVKHYDILNEFFTSDTLAPAAVEKSFVAILKLDYTLAEDLWEYMLIKLDPKLSDKNIAALYVDRVFELFMSAAAARALKTVSDRPVIQRAVFAFSPTADEGELFALPVNQLLSNKIDAVDAALKNLSKNELMSVSFGGYLVKFIDKFFIEIMKKNAQHRVELNRKQSTLLMSYAQKVKTDERAMLIQRIKEVM